MEASTCHNMRVDNYTLWFLVSIVTLRWSSLGLDLKASIFYQLPQITPS